MKHTFTLLVLLSVIIFSAQAQITLDSTNMPYVGFSESFAKDTPLTTVNYGQAGANQVYDFHALTNTITSTAVYSTPNTTQHNKFPTANLMVTTDNINYFAAQNTPAKYIAVGEQTTLASNKKAYTPFSPLDNVFEFTTQYGGNFTGNWGFTQAVDAADAGQSFPVDSVYITYTDTYYDTIDGWGIVKTPLGSYNCLREARRDVTHTHILATTDFGDQTVDTYSDAITYQYLAKETRGPVVKFDYDTGVNAANIKDIQYSLIPPTPIAHFTFVTGADGLITFTDSSSNSPASYSWTFGDGNTSTLKSPGHTYANDGAYYVCETVTNASGSNTYCDSVHVSNVTGPTAHFTWAAAGGGLIDFTNQNTGSPTTYSWTFGDGGTSNLANPTHTYTANGAYYACETVSNVNGTNTYCDSVHVTGILATHTAPVANRDTASIYKPNSDTINVKANDYSNGGDSFCITRITNPTYFTVLGCGDVIFNSSNATAPGVDSAQYVICNVNQPNLCDSAWVVVTVLKTHLPPVAVNDFDTVLQGGKTDTINVTLNDYSPSGDSFCISGGYGSGALFPINCNELQFIPNDSTFTGNDTAWYIICNNNQPTLCDTGEVIVTVEPHSVPCQLEDSIIWLPVGAGLQSINSNHYSVYFTAGTAASFTNPVDSFNWSIQTLNVGTPFDTVVRNSDTLIITSGEFQFNSYMLCLTAFSNCGSITTCDTVDLYWESINDLTLSNISIYPNPANNVLTIDMLHNTDDITADYAYIEVYNAIGQQVLSQPRSKQYKLADIPVTELSEGMYLATIVDSKGVRRTLGKFTVAR